MVEEDVHAVHRIGIGHSYCWTGEMGVADGIAENDGIANIVRPIAPIGVLVNQRLQNNTRRFEWICRNVSVIKFQMFQKCGITDIGLGVTWSFFVSLSIDHKIRAFVTIGTEKQRTFLKTERK